MKKDNTYLYIGIAAAAYIYFLNSNKAVKGVSGSTYTTDQISINFKGDLLEVTKQFYHYMKNNTFDSSNVLNTKVKALAYWADELKKANK